MGKNDMSLSSSNMYVIVEQRFLSTERDHYHQNNEAFLKTV